MARPAEKGLEYFPLDVDIENNDKIQLIEVKYGLIGFALYIKLLCKIYENGYYYPWTEREKLLFLRSIVNATLMYSKESLVQHDVTLMSSEKTLMQHNVNNNHHTDTINVNINPFSSHINVDINTLNAFINDCINFGLFDKELYEKYQILTSKGIQRRYLEATKRRKKVEMIKEYSLIDTTDFPNIVNVTLTSSISPLMQHDVNNNSNSCSDNVALMHSETPLMQQDVYNNPLKQSKENINNKKDLIPEEKEEMKRFILEIFHPFLGLIQKAEKKQYIEKYEPMEIRDSLLELGKLHGLSRLKKAVDIMVDRSKSTEIRNPWNYLIEVVNYHPP